MVQHDSLLMQALKLHRAGRLDKAASLYQEALDADPRNADALHLLSVIADARGEPTLAVALIGWALEIREQISFLCNLGMALGHVGRRGDVLDCYARALALRPDYPEALGI